jgi:hypothetical protein
MCFLPQIAGHGQKFCMIFQEVSGMERRLKVAGKILMKWDGKEIA